MGKQAFSYVKHVTHAGDIYKMEDAWCLCRSWNKGDLGSSLGPTVIAGKTYFKHTHTHILPWLMLRNSLNGISVLPFTLTKLNFVTKKMSWFLGYRCLSKR